MLATFGRLRHLISSAGGEPPGKRLAHIEGSFGLHSNTHGGLVCCTVIVFSSSAVPRVVAAPGLDLRGHHHPV